MISELEAWSGRCDDVLKDLEAEIAKVRSEAARAKAMETKSEKQVKAVMDAAEKGPAIGGSGGRALRGGKKPDYDDDEDAMDIDGGKGTKGFGGLMGRLGGSSRGGR